MNADELFKLLKVPDEVLVEVLREEQDEGAAEILYDRYHQKLYWFVYHKVSIGEDAEEIVQEALIKALVEKLDQFEERGPGSFRSWLYTITHNLIRDYRKKLVNQLFVSLDVLLVKGQRFTARRIHRPLATEGLHRTHSS